CSLCRLHDGAVYEDGQHRSDDRSSPRAVHVPDLRWPLSTGANGVLAAVRARQQPRLVRRRCPRRHIPTPTPWLRSGHPWAVRVSAVVTEAAEYSSATEQHHLSEGL